MAQTLYLMRHGQTLFNKQNKIQGWTDSPLTDTGIEQTKIAAKYFEEEDIEIESAYASTSERASDTLELVTDIDYTRLKGLKEWNFGLFEAEHEYLNPSLPYGDFFKEYGGEGEDEFRQRMADTIMEIMQNETADNVLAVSHGASLAQFAIEWEDTAFIERPSPMTNCCILKFTFENNTFRLEEAIQHDFSELDKE